MEAWAPAYLDIEHLSLDLRSEEPRIDVEVRTTRSPEAVDVAALYELVASIVPKPVVGLEISEIRRYELRRETGSVSR
jgi:hypothetical protein